MVMAIRKQPRFDLHILHRGGFLLAEMHINGEVFEAGRIRSQLVEDSDAHDCWVRNMVRLVEEDVRSTMGAGVEFKLVERS
jgi:hypothetical protein